MTPFISQPEALAQAVISSAPDGIVLVDDTDRILLANPAMEAICGYAIAELLGQSVEIFLPPAVRERHRKNVRHYDQNPRPRPMGLVENLSLLHKSGRAIPVDIALGQFQRDGATVTVVFVRDISGIKELERQMQFHATRDALTGLANRWLFNQHLAQALRQTERQAGKLALLLLDLDDFKSANDRHGHAVGDLVLIEAARRITASVRTGDLTARIGGDEFVVLLRDVETSGDAVVVAEKIVDALALPCVVQGHDVALGGSIGIAYCPDDAQDAETLMRYADMAMYRAKALGRGQCTVYSASMAEQIARRALVRERLTLALENDGLHLHYQPQVSVSTGAVSGVEALLRWTDPDLGEQHPADFIPIAESTDLIVQIGDWVIETACRQAVAWRDAGTPLRVAVNLSARQFRDEGLSDQIRATLTRQGLEPELLELEITESEAMAHPKRTGQLLQRLQGFGVAVALDDFGTGHSSLAYLRELPVTRLKIDREFICPIGEPGTEATLVKAILGLASTLGLDVVAEGVETQAQLDFLRANGCGAYQGWLFAKALPADQVPALLRRRP